MLNAQLFLKFKPAKIKKAERILLSASLSFNDKRRNHYV
jgi:uncharacterized lipoprotein YbaY